MNLKYTQALMRRMADEKRFDSYAVQVKVGTDYERFFSENVNGDTLFDIASCGKVLHTTTIAFQMMDEGKLSLDSTLGDFFPYAPEDKKRITIRQILTHTSGIIRYPLQAELCAQGTDAIAKEILSKPLAFEPGSLYTYSCNAMNLLGFIEEKIDGKLMEQMFMERVKKPMGMTRSCFKILPEEKNVAVCHRQRPPFPICFDDENVTAMNRVCGAGGSFFSPNDVRVFVEGVMAKDERLFKKEYFELAERDYTSQLDWVPGREEGRGLGFLFVNGRYPQTGRLFPVGSFGHCGHTGQSFFMNRRKNLYVIIMTNATRFNLIKYDFLREDYSEICAMRQEIHNEIYRDLTEQHLLDD